MRKNTRNSPHSAPLSAPYFERPEADQNGGTPMVAACDDHGYAVRGLWRRGDLYYAQIAIPNAVGQMCQTKRSLGRFGTVAAAYDARERLQKDVHDGIVKPVRELADRPLFPEPAGLRKRAPNQVRNLAWLAGLYREHTAGMRQKQPSTLATEAKSWKQINRIIGQTPLANLTPRVIESYKLERMKGGTTKGTAVNNELIFLRGVARYARQQGLLTADFTYEVEWVKVRPKPFPLVTQEQLDRIIAAVNETVAKGCFLESSGTLLKNYLKFLAHTGARWTEAKVIRWEDIDWVNSQVNFGMTGIAKNGRTRVVDFNPPLKRHLLAMKAARDAQPEAERSTWLFPKVKNRYEHTEHFDNMIIRVHEVTGVALGGFHNLRRFFASWCVMQGIDFMTIARWLGHEDGGMLVTRTYGKISNPHAKRMAGTLEFKWADDDTAVPVDPPAA